MLQTDINVSAAFMTHWTIVKMKTFVVLWEKVEKWNLIYVKLKVHYCDSNLLTGFTTGSN